MNLPLVSRNFIAGIVHYLLVGGLSMLFLTSCDDTSSYQPLTTVSHRSGGDFVASGSCMECHKSIYETHLKTAHYLTSSLPRATTIGDFSNDGNSLMINDSLQIQISSRDGNYYHSTTDVKNGTLFDEKKIDMIIGSGTKGKAYLNWQQDSLFQLHASYFSATQSLIKSPGYSSTGKLQNNRPITERCLECHTTYAEAKTVKNTYDRSRILLGIDCQRCHGPSADHVSFHKNNPDATKARNMIVINSLSRNDQIGLCALCHSGPRKNASQPRFSYKVGDQLDKSSTQDFFSTAASLDVHGNQVGMLKASKCFQKSEAMTCTTCHDPHKNQRSESSYFVNKCLECHSKHDDTKCSLPELQRGSKNCVDCHMPSTVSNTMFAKNSITKDTVNVSVVSHFISVYRDGLMNK